MIDSRNLHVTWVVPPYPLYPEFGISLQELFSLHAGMRKLSSHRYGIPEHLLHQTLVFGLGIRILMDAAVMVSIDFLQQLGPETQSS